MVSLSLTCVSRAPGLGRPGVHFLLHPLHAARADVPVSTAVLRGFELSREDKCVAAQIRDAERSTGFYETDLRTAVRRHVLRNQIAALGVKYSAEVPSKKHAKNLPGTLGNGDR